MFEIILSISKLKQKINTDADILKNFSGLIVVDVNGEAALQQRDTQTLAMANADFIKTFSSVGNGDFEFSFNIYLTDYPSEYMELFNFVYEGGTFGCRFGDRGFGHRLQFTEYSFKNFDTIINSDIQKEELVGNWTNIRFLRKDRKIYLYVNDEQRLMRRGGLSSDITDPYVESDYDISKFSSMRLGTNKESSVTPIFTNLRFSFVNGYEPIF